MQFKLLALSAIAASVSAQSSSLNPLSVLSVLETALPSSLLAEALTNSAAVSSQIASEFSAGSTPSWFSALPTPIQSYLTHGSGSNATSAVISNISNATALANSTTISRSGTAVTTKAVLPHHHTKSAGSAGTLTSTQSVSGMASSSAPAAGSSSAAAASASSGSGAIPTAVVGAGLAGVVGIVGLFAL